MPPIVHVGSVVAEWDAPGGTFTVAVPEGARENDTLLLVVVINDPTGEVSGFDSLSLELTGWTLVQSVATGANAVIALSRPYTEDLNGHVFEGIVAPGATDGAAAMLALRGVASIPATLAATDSVTVKNHSAPSQTLGSALGWLVGVWCMDAALDVLPSGAGYHDYAIESDDGTRWLTIGWFARELAGASGVYTANSVASISGVSASLQLEAMPAPDLAFSLMPVGSFGLPSEGI